MDNRPYEKVSDASLEIMLSEAQWREHVAVTQIANIIEEQVLRAVDKGLTDC